MRLCTPIAAPPLCSRVCVAVPGLPGAGGGACEAKGRRGTARALGRHFSVPALFGCKHLFALAWPRLRVYACVVVHGLPLQEAELAKRKAVEVRPVRWAGTFPCLPSSDASIILRSRVPASVFTCVWLCAACPVVGGGACEAKGRRGTARALGRHFSVPALFGCKHLFAFACPRRHCVHLCVCLCMCVSAYVRTLRVCVLLLLRKSWKSWFRRPG
jgi:hypothetical protein